MGGLRTPRALSLELKDSLNHVGRQLLSIPAEWMRVESSQFWSSSDVPLDWNTRFSKIRHHPLR